MNHSEHGGLEGKGKSLNPENLHHGRNEMNCHKHADMTEDNCCIKA